LTVPEEVDQMKRMALYDQIQSAFQDDIRERLAALEARRV
jgi:hypothetical protein